MHAYDDIMAQFVVATSTQPIDIDPGFLYVGCDIGKLYPRKLLTLVEAPLVKNVTVPALPIGEEQYLPKVVI